MAIEIQGNVTVGGNVVIGPKEFAVGTGGTITTITDPVDGLTYTLHTFTSTGTFNLNVVYPIQYLVVGAGGSGGTGLFEGSTDGCGGGGGGGQVILGNSTSLAPGSYTITVGQTSSNDSQILKADTGFSINANGGAEGGYWANARPVYGATTLRGPGGGGGPGPGTLQTSPAITVGTTMAGGSAFPNKAGGNGGPWAPNGGNWPLAYNLGGGGGGSGDPNGGAGGNASSGNPTNNGTAGSGGSSSPIGFNGSYDYYGSGGGGGIGGGSGTPGSGGINAGSGASYNVNATSATNNRGGGGGGFAVRVSPTPIYKSQSAGGSGVVMIRYLSLPT